MEFEGYRVESPTPPTHHHWGPWAVFRAYDPTRHTPADRELAARALQGVAFDTTRDPAWAVRAAARSLDTAAQARREARAIDPAEVTFRGLCDDPTEAERMIAWALDSR